MKLTLICSAINPRVVSKAKRNDALSGSNLKITCKQTLKKVTTPSLIEALHYSLPGRIELLLP